MNILNESLPFKHAEFMKTFWLWLSLLSGCWILQRDILELFQPQISRAAEKPTQLKLLGVAIKGSSEQDGVMQEGDFTTLLFCLFKINILQSRQSIIDAQIDGIPVLISVILLAIF